MDARILKAAWLAALLLVSMGAQQRSANFIVTTADPNFAQQVAQAAEQYRRDLAIEWLGQPLPNWSRPCPITVQVGGGAGGAPQFVFDQGEVFNWQMSIQGSRERILDSVLPHEITHMIFASHFRQPVPRWADEGGATSVEHASERNKHRQMLRQFLQTGRGIAFDRMFAMTEYPHDIMPLYAQGYSLAEYLIQIGGRRKYIEFLGDGLNSDDWPGAVQRHYGVQNLAALQNTWLAWVRQGSPNPTQPAPAGEMLASNNNQRRPRPEPNLIYRTRNNQPAQTATPLAALVPVHLTSGVPLAGEGTERRTAAVSTPLRWVKPAGNMEEDRPILASQKSGQSPTTTMAAGWHAPGQSPAVEPATTQVAHPQPIEHPRQTILR